MESPILIEKSTTIFPSIDTFSMEVPIAIGGNLSPEMLLSAYRQGVFPWSIENGYIHWWRTDPRCVLYPDEVNISQSMRKILKQNRFRFTMDTVFPEVISHCSTIPRKEEEGTWITEDIRKAYIQMHELGYAHSVEVWENDELIGGLYGISLGRCFFGESMFSLQPNGSKAALIALCQTLSTAGFTIIDCQVYSPYLGKMGAKMIPCNDFLKILKKGVDRKNKLGTGPTFS